MTTPKISIIIGMWNAESTIKQCIDSLLSQSYPKEKYEIIVVDDGSEDRSVQIAKESGADVVISSKHVSVGHAKNLGLEKAKGKFLAIIDSDCIAKDGWLETIERELKNVQAITGPIENGNVTSKIAWAEYLLAFSAYNNNTKRSKVSSCAGCNQAHIKENIISVGGFFDVPSSDDVFLSNALKEKGIDIYFIPEMKIEHFGLNNKDKFLSKFRRRGRGFVDTRKKLDHVKYKFLTKNKISIIALIFGLLVLRTSYAIKARKFLIFLKVYPIILSGISAYFKGCLDEISKNK